MRELKVTEVRSGKWSKYKDEANLGNSDMVD